MDRLYSILFTWLVLLGGFWFANEVAKKTVFTVNEPLIVDRVPPVTLEPGSCSIWLFSSDSSRRLVGIRCPEAGDDLVIRRRMVVTDHENSGEQYVTPHAGIL